MLQSCQGCSRWQMVTNISMANIAALIDNSLQITTLFFSSNFKLQVTRTLTVKSYPAAKAR